jgi:hypothetical protein
VLKGWSTSWRGVTTVFRLNITLAIAYLPRDGDGDSHSTQHDSNATSRMVFESAHGDTWQQMCAMSKIFTPEGVMYKFTFACKTALAIFTTILH